MSASSRVSAATPSVFSQARLRAAHTYGHATPVRPAPHSITVLRASIATQTPPIDAVLLPRSQHVQMSPCSIFYEDYFRFGAFTFPIQHTACAHCGVSYAQHPHCHACSLLRHECWPIPCQQHAAPRCEQCGVCISQHSSGGSGNNRRQRRARVRKHAQSVALQPRIAHMRTPISHITDAPARIYEDIDEYDDDSRARYLNHRNDE